MVTLINSDLIQEELEKIKTRGGWATLEYYTQSPFCKLNKYEKWAIMIKLTENQMLVSENQLQKESFLDEFEPLLHTIEIIHEKYKDCLITKEALQEKGFNHYFTTHEN